MRARHASRIPHDEDTHIDTQLPIIGSMSPLPRTVFVLLAWITLYSAGTANAGELQPYPESGQTPPLVLEDLRGRSHTLADYRDQVVLVNFWATWCPPCLMEMPSMQRLKQKLAGQPFTILAVNVRESPGTIWRFLKRIRVDFPLLLDIEGSTSEDWDVSVYPTSFLLDTNGRIRHVVHGALEWDNAAIVETIEGLMGGRRDEKPKLQGDSFPAPDFPEKG